MTRKELSKEDVQKLLHDPSGEARIATATKLASEFDGTLSASERALAEEIFRIMVKDAEVRVREALALNLKENPNLPHDVAVSLANDVDSVALPVLQFSDILSDEDLISIVRSQDPAKQTAIAGRTSVSSQLSDALVETGNEDAVAALVGNEGADISEKTLQKVVDGFGGAERVQSAMVGRSKLPVTVSERLVTLVSEQMKSELAKKHELPAGLATDLILQTRERAIIGLSTESGEQDVEALVHQLHKNGRLTASICLRALCMGDLVFFEAALAELTDISLVNARNLIHDSGELGLRALYDKAGLPEAYFTAARAGIDVARENQYDGEPNDRERYSRRMIERILTQYGDLGVEFDSDDLEYLMGKMNQLQGDVRPGG
ncbi:MAG: DUF2336 domain-containing protein [Rhodospirillales bacterium]|nr:DUF2336 domain-containing protein [Rhodospirillales bacterium]